MTKIKLVLFIAIIGALIIAACSINDTAAIIKEKTGKSTGNTGTVKFTFVKEITRNSIFDAASILITITDEDNIIVHENKQLNLYYYDGSFISEQISLVTGNYKLTEFLVLDSNNDVIFLTPIEGSAKSHLVNDPLEIDFAIDKDTIEQVVPEIIDASEGLPSDFGYATFSFNIIEYFDFLVSASAYNELTGNNELIPAEITVYGDTDLLFSGSISAGTNMISVNDSYSEYSVTIIGSNDYREWNAVYTNAELKACFLNPITAVLLKNELVIGEWEMIKLITERTVSGESWDTISSLIYDDDFYYMWRGNVDHWNQSNIWTGSISAVSPETDTHTLLSTLTYDGHPYSSVWNFSIDICGLVEVDDVFYGVLDGHTANLSTNHPIAVIKSSDRGVTWEQHQLLAEPDAAWCYSGITMLKADNGVYIYYKVRDNSDGTYKYYYVFSTKMQFDMESAVELGPDYSDRLSYSIIKYNNKYYNFFRKQDTGGDYAVYFTSSDSPDFTDMSEDKLFMEYGISEYDIDSIRPSFIIDGNYIYAIAITNPWATSDYGFNNANKIVLYKAEIIE